MRKSSPLLAPLFAPIMQGVLVATVLQAREWYLSDLAAHLAVGPSSLQKTLANLTRAGILIRRRDGNRVYYQADPLCPILADLQHILTKTIGVAEPLRDALAPFASKITAAFIHGSIAEEREHSQSDIDIILIADVSGPDLMAALHPSQNSLGREVNFTRYTPKEFKTKIAAKHHFLTSVLDKPRIFLIGNEHDLDRIAGGKASRRRADQQNRNRSDSRDD